MPEKHFLELAIDIRQRKDKRKLFAEPVDPEKVPDYYNCIENPMDLSNLRENLDQGVYESLDAFERDVLLIFSNAAFYNEENTIYAKKAREIHDLFIKVFYTLRYDPKKLELEFRVPGRKPTSEVQTSVVPDAKLDTIVRQGGLTSIASRGRRHLNHLSNTGSRQENPRASKSSPREQERNKGSLGHKEGGKLKSIEEGRCDTYRPWNSFLKEDESFISDVYNSAKLFVPNNEYGTRYEESIMRFAKDLGPTAQMVANHNARQCQIGASKSQIHEHGADVVAPNGTCVYGSTVTLFSNNGSQGMGEHREESDPPQNGSLEIVNECEADLNTHTPSGGNGYLGMMLACLSDTESPCVLPQSMSLESGSSSSSLMKTDSNTLKPSCVLQPMLRDFNTVQAPSSSYTNPVSMIQSSPVVEHSQTRGNLHGVNNLSQAKTLAGQIGGATIAPSPSVILGLTREENSTRGRGSIYEHINNLSHHPNSVMHEEQCWPLNRGNQTNLLSLQWFSAENQNNNNLIGGASSSQRGSLSCKQPDLDQLIGWNESGLGFVSKGANERGITREANYLSSYQSNSGGQVHSNSCLAGFGLNPGNEKSNLCLSSYYKDAGSGGSSVQTDLDGIMSNGLHGKYHNELMDAATEPRQYGTGRTQAEIQTGNSLLLDWCQNQQGQSLSKSHLQSQDVYMETGIFNDNGMRQSSPWVSHQYFNVNGNGTGTGTGSANGNGYGSVAHKSP